MPRIVVKVRFDEVEWSINCIVLSRSKLFLKFSFSQFTTVYVVGSTGWQQERCHAALCFSSVASSLVENVVINVCIYMCSSSSTQSYIPVVRCYANLAPRRLPVHNGEVDRYTVCPLTVCCCVSGTVKGVKKLKKTWKSAEEERCLKQTYNQKKKRWLVHNHASVLEN